MELLGSPQLSYPCIHIAGTNGKTSVARMIDALLTAFGQRTGRTTSPHLQSAVERIAIDGQPITPARYVETYREIEPFVHMIDAKSEDEGGPAMSKFEVVTAMAFAAFADAPVDIAVIEVGMGGRWDATNVVDAAVAVITPIGVDHAEYLGETIAEIAAEKAGIIGAPRGELVPVDTVAVIGRQRPRRWRCCWPRRCGPTPRWARADSEFAVLSRQVAVGGQLLELQGLGGVYPTCSCRCTASTKAQNAALALAAVEAFFGAGAQRQLDIDAVRAGFAAAASPGRLERMRSAPTVFIDAAHNPAGAAAFRRRADHRVRLPLPGRVLGVMADKDVTAMLAAFEPVFSQVVVTSNGSPRALDVDTLLLRAEEIFGPERVVRADTLPDAIEAATALVEDSAVESDGFSGAASSSPGRWSPPGGPHAVRKGSAMSDDTPGPTVAGPDPGRAFAASWPAPSSWRRSSCCWRCRWSRRWAVASRRGRRPTWSASRCCWCCSPASRGTVGHLGEPWRATDPDRRFPWSIPRSDSSVCSSPWCGC